MITPRAVSVTEKGEPDGWEIPTAWYGERDPAGQTRLVVSVPTDRLLDVHRALLGVLDGPLGVLYRQKVDRASPRPDGAPDRDFVNVDLGHGKLLTGLGLAKKLLSSDARGELWVRGRLQDQVILDTDGVLYCYPDDPAFRDALKANGVPEAEVQTLWQRDYVKHNYLAECDAEERALINALTLTEVAPQRS